MKQLLEILNLSKEYLEKKGISAPKRQAEEMIADTLGINRIELYMQYDRPLTKEELDRIRSRLDRRGKGEPLQQILGYVDFLDCRIQVTRDVLIPRQETEILADQIAKRISRESLEGKSLLDLCCGSGCLGISLKKKFPALQVVLSDISTQALTVAKSNAEANGIEAEIVHGDFFKPLTGRIFDYIVCNPPYVSDSEFAEIDREVKNFEPRQALVAGMNGLEYYHRFSEEAKNFLKENGSAWLEIGATQGEDVRTIFIGGSWKSCLIRQDWSGKDRFCEVNI